MRTLNVPSQGLFLAFFAIGFLDFIGKRIFSVSLVFVLAISTPSEFQVVFFVLVRSSVYVYIYSLFCSALVCVYISQDDKMRQRHVVRYLKYPDPKIIE